MGNLRGDFEEGLLYTTFDNLALQSNWLCVLDGFHTESISEKFT